MAEIWKDIKGYEGLYQISNLGNVKTLPKRIFRLGKTCIYKEKILKNVKQNNGYYVVTLYKNNKQTILLVHRLVAQAFIPNPFNKPVVNHKDYNPSNNKADNLEWTTQSENLEYSKDNLVKSYLNTRQSKTGEHYIYYGRRSGFYFRYCPKKILKSFKTLEEAIKYRQEVLGF